MGANEGNSKVGSFGEKVPTTGVEGKSMLGTGDSVVEGDFGEREGMSSDGREDGNESKFGAGEGDSNVGAGKGKADNSGIGTEDRTYET